MPTRADVPALTDTLCEHCGYGLNGLPTDGRCPECGEPIADSTVDDGRVPPAWENGERSTWKLFLITATRIVFNPAMFFRHFQTRRSERSSGLSVRPVRDVDRSRAFALRVYLINSVLLGASATIHADAMGFLQDGLASFAGMILTAGMTIAVFVSLVSVTKLAAALTSWEGGYWGYRLPPAVVRRAMNYHSAQLLPVAIIAFTTVAGYLVLLATGILDALAGVPYLVVISIEVLLAAGYLFRTYWIAMKNIMYANR